MLEDGQTDARSDGERTLLRLAPQGAAGASRPRLAVGPLRGPSIRTPSLAIRTRHFYRRGVPKVETRCWQEQSMVALLEKRGWRIVDSTRRGVDLDLDVEFEGQAGRVLFRSDFEAPKGISAPDPLPCFVRIDLGVPAVPPERWALWDRYQFYSGKHMPRYVATVVHEAIGDSFVSVAGNAVSSKRNSQWSSYDATFEILLKHAEALSPGRDVAARRGHIFALARQNFGRQTKKFQPWIILALLANFVVVPIIYVWGRGGAMAALEAAPYLLGIVLFILAIFGLVALVRRARQPKGPVEGMPAVADWLRAAGGFQHLELTRAKKRDGLPVVCRQDGYLARGGAPLWVSRLIATSSSPQLRLEADLCRVRWPEGTIEECRIVPDRWLLVEVAGADEDLALLPSGIREDRYEGKVRWVLTGEEIDTGRAADLFHSLCGAKSGAGPYR